MKDLSFLGVDISKDSITVYDGKKLYTFPNERYLKKFKERIFKRLNKEKTVIIYEPTGPYSSFLEEFAAVEQIKVVAINPRKTPYLLEVMSHRAKTDALDAKALYEYAKLIDKKDIRTVDLDDDLEELSFLLAEYRFIKKQRVNFINHLESIKHNPKSDKEGKDHIESIVLQLNERLKSIEKKVKKLIEKKDKIKETVKKIESINGIGFLTAANLFLFFEKKQVKNRKEAAALIGLDPIVYESGKKKINKRISKQGDAYIRHLVYMAGMCAIRTNDTIKEFFERLVSNGKKKKVALVACMRKLLIAALAQYKNAYLEKTH